METEMGKDRRGKSPPPDRGRFSLNRGEVDTSINQEESCAGLTNDLMKVSRAREILGDRCICAVSGLSLNYKGLRNVV